MGLPVTQLCRLQMGRPWIRLMASLSLSFHTWVMWVELEGAGQELAWPSLENQDQGQSFALGAVKSLMSFDQSAGQEVLHFKGLSCAPGNGQHQWLRPVVLDTGLPTKSSQPQYTGESESILGWKGPQRALPFHRRGNRGPERCSDLPIVTCPVHVMRARPRRGLETQKGDRHGACLEETPSY